MRQRPRCADARPISVRSHSAARSAAISGGGSTWMRILQRVTKVVDAWLPIAFFSHYAVPDSRVAPLPTIGASRSVSSMWMSPVKYSFCFSLLLAPLIDPVGFGDTRIGLWATAVLAEEPGQIRGAVLLVTAKVVDTGPAEIAKEQCAASLIAVFLIAADSPVALVVAAFQRIKWIELCAYRRDDA